MSENNTGVCAPPPVTYPLWCLDNGDATDEQRYRGPFTDEASAKKELAFVRNDRRPWKICRCRQVRVSEIRTSFVGVAESVQEMLDEAAREDGLSHADAWADWEEPIVGFGTANAEAARAGLAQWCDRNLVARAFVCEPDEGTT